MKVKELIQNNPDGLLNIFFTAGYPNLTSTVQVANHLAAAGIRMVEIGMPFSDPLADGKTIQDSSETALRNGMNIDIMFEQVEEINANTDLVIILMGYYNQLLTIGMVKFLEKCKTTGVDGLIIPDLPMEIYEQEYKDLFEEYEIAISFLITPRTSLARIQMADRLSSGFIYLVADNSITGAASGSFSTAQIDYFERIKQNNLISPVLIGFGIKTSSQYKLTKKYANGAIIGSEFIRKLSTMATISQEPISRFVNSITNC